MRTTSISRIFGLSFLALSSCALSALTPAWAQDPPTTDAPVPGASAAAAAAAVSGSGATTGAASDPLSATVIQRASGSTATSSASSSTRRRQKRGGKAREGVIEPWSGRRVLLLLPLKLGPGFNADQAFGQAILSRTETELQEELSETGKFSVIRAHRFSPLIQRGLQEKRLTEAQAQATINNPLVEPGQAAPPPATVETATTFLQQFTFDQVPMIAEFFLEEVRASGTGNRTSVQAQVAGRLYEVGNPVALKAPVVRSDAFSRGRNNIERYQGAARNAFAQIADEFTAPLEDVQLPMVTPAPAPVALTPEPEVPAATMPEPVAPAPLAGAGGNANTPLPGDVSIAGASSRTSGTAGGVPQLPSATPPLGIAVPNAPAAR
jgi:hypothetical protein